MANLENMNGMSSDKDEQEDGSSGIPSTPESAGADRPRGNLISVLAVAGICGVLAFGGYKFMKPFLSSGGDAEVSQIQPVPAGAPHVSVVQPVGDMGSPAHDAGSEIDLVTTADDGIQDATTPAAGPEQPVSATPVPGKSDASDSARCAAGSGDPARCAQPPENAAQPSAVYEARLNEIEQRLAGIEKNLIRVESISRQSAYRHKPVAKKADTAAKPAADTAAKPAADTASPAVPVVASGTDSMAPAAVAVVPAAKAVSAPSLKGSIQTENRDSWNVYAVVPGRAWIKRASGERVSVAVGDAVPGYGTVTGIDPDSGLVNTTEGRIN